MVKKLSLLLTFFGGVFLALLSASSVGAAVLENAWVSMSNPVSSGSSNHTFYFYHPTNTLGSVKFQYCVAPSGTCADTDIGSLAAVTLSSVTKAGGAVTTTWDDFGSTYSDATWYLQAFRDSADVAATSYYSFTWANIPNPVFGTCNYTTNTETGTCYVKINSYTNTTGVSAADSTVISLTVTQAVTITATVDPSFTFRIAAVDEGTTTTVNGSTLTTGIDPTVTTIPFGNLTPGTPKYLGHSLTVTTNATNGYDITVVMSANMLGTAYGDDIDAFVGNSATNAADESWLEPTGTASGTNTGWLGVGTDDTDVQNRDPGTANNNLFFSLGTTATTVAEHTTSASAEVDLVVYGIEVNSFQEADSYSGVMRYQALPVY